MDAIAPGVPLLTGVVRTDYRGQHPLGFADLGLIVPLAPAPTTPQVAPTARFVIQTRVYLDVEEPDRQGPEDWESVQVEAAARVYQIDTADGDVLVDVRVAALSAAGIASEFLIAVERYPLAGVASLPTSLSFLPARLTDAAGSRVALVATWTGASETDRFVVRYRRGIEPWVELPSQSEPFLEIAPAPAGIWSIEVRAQNLFGSLSDAVTAEAVMELGDADFEIPAPSGLELVGIEGILLGASREWTGRDVKIRWNAVRTDALQTAAVGTAPDDGLLEFAIIKVRDPDTGFLIREETLPISVNEWSYKYHDHEQDGLRRSLRLEVAFKDRSGRLSSFTPIEVSNPAPFATTFVADPGLSRLSWTMALPSNPDPDIAGVLLFFSDTPGFTPTADDVLSDTALPGSLLTSVAVGSVVIQGGLDVYIRAAFYDAFTKDPALLNFAPEEHVVIPLADTPDFESQSVNTVVIVTDDDDVDMNGIALAYATWYEIVDQTFVVAEAPTLAITFEDILAITPSVSSGNTIEVLYKVEVYDETDMVMLRTVTRAFYSATGFAAATDTFFSDPYFHLPVACTPGNTVNVSVFFKRTRTTGGDSVNAVSQERRTTLHQVKR